MKKEIIIQRKWLEKLIKKADELEKDQKNVGKFYQLLGYISSAKDILKIN